MAKAGNAQLGKAKKDKKDEFYTRLEDIEREVRHYEQHFKGKTVLCNCDDPRVSNFFHYFSYRFEALGLKRLITTCYKNQERDLFSQNDSERAIWLEYTGDKNGNRIPDPEEIGIRYFKGDGDFRSEECIELLKQADIVVTNPPFSLFREYVEQLIKYDKKFLIIGNKNAIHYKEIFTLIMTNKMWVGYTPMSRDLLFEWPEFMQEEALANGKHGSKFRILDGKVFGRSPSIWFTNLEHAKRHEEYVFIRHYSPSDYPKYQNLEAIDIGKSEDIPEEWHDLMGVPDTFLERYNPEQFEIVGLGCGDLAKQIGVRKNFRGRTDVALKIDGKDKCPYSRIIIRRRHKEEKS